MKKNNKRTEIKKAILDNGDIVEYDALSFAKYPSLYAPGCTQIGRGKIHSINNVPSDDTNEYIFWVFNNATKAAIHNAREKDQ